MGAAAIAGPLLGAGLSTLTGLFSKPKPITTTSSSTTNQNYNNQSNQTGSSTPVFGEEKSSIANVLAQLLGSQAKNTDLGGYEANAIKNINSASGIKEKLLNNLLAARGLSYSAAAPTAQAGLQNQRVSDITQLRNSIPLLQRQVQGDTIGQFQNFFSSLPFGQSTTGNYQGSGSSTSDTKGTSTQSGGTPGALGGALGGLAGGVGTFFGDFLSGKKSSGGGSNYINPGGEG